MGCATLTQEHKLQTLPHFCRSYVAKRGHRQTIVEPDQTIEVYSKAYSIGDTLGEQLEFALKYEGGNLEILSELFEKVDPEELVRYIKTKPTDKQARRIWHLYEFLTGKQLALDDLKKFSRYDTLLDEKQYFTGNKKASKRHKIHDNLLGNRLYCPKVRRTPVFEQFIGAKLDERCQAVLRQFLEDILQRALDYLYTKETKSSFEIERILPDKSRTARFVALLKRAGTDRFLNKEALIGL